MTENAKLFFQQLSANRELAEKVAQMEKDEIIATAVQMGIPLTEADLEPAEEVSDNELAGGKTCACVLGGGGERGDKDDICGCFAFGIGYDKSYEEYIRCMCNMAGGGVSANKNEDEE